MKQMMVNGIFEILYLLHSLCMKSFWKVFLEGVLLLLEVRTIQVAAILYFSRSYPSYEYS